MSTLLMIKHYAEQFEDSDPAKGQSPEELLQKARMLFSTELGKDPLLRSQMRKLFKEARVTAERGITKIDENYPYFVSCSCFRSDSKLIISRTSKYLYQKPINNMLNSGQFLLQKTNILLLSRHLFLKRFS